ncbi:MAG: ATP-binding cassette domain-containing protein [Phycisphaerae bacterium]|nr:ATP-binding cassette domain-containing protein [Phycisphaerae bacterium]
MALGVMQIEFQQVSKTFGGGAGRTRAVDQASWEAHGGEVFGLLGPNGAGKTTIIRMMLDIFRPDEGAILVNGTPNGNRSQDFKNRVGYLPEERGLYKKRKVMDVLAYLAALKGVSKAEAHKSAGVLLERFGLAEYANKKIKTLSKGMSQKLQTVSCVLHDPDLVVFDEPFSGLDPVNVRLVRDLVLDLKRAGKLVFLSTHMMAEVEAVCDRIIMIDRGRQILCGELGEIKKAHTDYDIVVDAQAQPDGLDCVAKVVIVGSRKRVWLRDGKTMNDLMLEMGRAGKSVKHLEEGAQPLEDIFVALVTRNQDASPGIGAANAGGQRP